ncbi:TRADD-N-associated membrane domain-containing protein [Streptomyces purpurascens]|uniref:TRADD-N-associated membrane domain-containing protein n=1 Tax=Streptomyces purpurascens TaxID=1924 RepID=UPI0016732F83|nr:hypothetical protein [Streptomyces purpurascens]MCE7045048.1 hypothetical protein [Streptomyces purpurascens]GHA13077.1 hypothetical protein GCM10010303_24000 [Streptomyces purpurascens]
MSDEQFSYGYLDPFSARRYVIGVPQPEDASSTEYPLRWREPQWEQWLASKERKKAIRWRNGLFYAAGALLIIAICTGVSSLLFGMGWRVTVVIFVAGLLVTLLCVAGATYTYRGAETSFVPTGLQAEGTAGLDSPRLFKDPDLQNLIVLNRTQMQVYHEIATKQARLASRNSRLAIAVGFVVLIVGAVAAIRTSDETSKIVIGALALIGSLLSTYISRTFLISEDRAMAQLNYYFRQPLVTSYVLSAERLTHKLAEARRDDLVTEVVQGVLAAAHNAYDGESSRGTSRRRFIRGHGVHEREAPEGPDGARPQDASELK